MASQRRARVAPISLGASTETFSIASRAALNRKCIKKSSARQPVEIHCGWDHVPKLNEKKEKKKKKTKKNEEQKKEKEKSKRKNT
ncbi:hypothetical protein WN48_05933 [Eufriesea mexicana]|nr:hypothetical protein WN48_05933 [Eufriesea mexicana]